MTNFQQVGGSFGGRHMDSYCGGLGQVGDFLFVPFVDSGIYQMKALIATITNIDVIFDNWFFLLPGPRQVGMRGAWWWSTWSSTPTSPTTRTTWVTFYKQHILGHICIQINKTMNQPLPALLKLPRPAPSSLAPLCLPPPSTDNLLGLRYFLELIDFFSFDYSILDKRTDVAKNIDF